MYSERDDRVPNPVVGQWWKFDHYEIRDGYIEPSPNASLQRYDPWDPDLRRSGSVTKPDLSPYRRLVDLAARFDTRDVLEWVQQNGLLGLLLHRLRSVRFAPRWDRAALLPSNEILFPVAEEWHWANTGWASWRPLTREWVLTKEPERRGEVVAEEDTSLRPSVVLRDQGGVGWVSESLDVTWATFFPSVPVEQRIEYAYPPPISEEFWRLYAEPLSDFYAAAQRLRNALEDLAARGGKKLGTLEQEERVDRGKKVLNSLIAPISPAVITPGEGGLLLRWVSPALLSTLATIAAEEAAKAPVRICARTDCANPFINQHRQTLYCSDTCKQTEAARRRPRR